MTQNRSLLMLKKNKKTLQIISCLIKERSIREHQDQSQCPGYLNQILHVRAASSVGIITFYVLTVVYFHTALYAFPKVLNRKICLTIKSFVNW